MDYIITTEQLTKKYKNFTSVNNVSLHIRKGSIYGFLGPNGAGKSTTMKMLLGLTAPTKGSFTIDGKQFPNDRISILKEIGSFIEAPSFYANLTGRENLDIIRRILGLPKADVEDALELVGLTEFGDRLAKKYSLGMKQRLGLAGALLGRPPILILDEPTNGLDPSGIHEIRNLVKSLPSLYDCTVLISSHMLSEIELIADDIGILNHGRLLFEGGMNDLRQYALQSGFLTSMPVLSFMLLISSRFENMWVPLGIGVAGFLSGMALANSGLALLLVHPFVIILKPAVAMSAQPDPTVALVALAETLLFLAVGLWLAKYRRYE